MLTLTGQMDSRLRGNDRVAYRVAYGQGYKFLRPCAKASRRYFLRYNADSLTRQFVAGLVPNLSSQLAELDAQKLLRKRRVVSGSQSTQLVVDGNTYLSFCSNDYLGLANHPALVEALIRGVKEHGVGAAASHLISGHMGPHQALEIALAQFVGLPRALYFSNGYAANTGVIPAFAGMTTF